MIRQEQIEEMAKIVDEMYNVYTTTADDIAEGIYDAGYQKAEEVRKETAEKILNELIDSSNKITFFDCRMALGLDKLAKQYGVEVEE